MGLFHGDGGVVLVVGIGGDVGVVLASVLYNK